MTAAVKWSNYVEHLFKVDCSESAASILPVHQVCTWSCSMLTILWRSRRPVSLMQPAVDELVDWSAINHMNINGKITKEMILDSLQRYSTPPLVISDQVVEQVSIFMLLGVSVNDCWRWNDHVDSIAAKANKRLWFWRDSDEPEFHKTTLCTIMKQSLDQF